MPACLFALRSFLFALLALICLGGPAQAQALPALSATEIEAFTARIEDPAEREKLVQNLRALAAAARAEQGRSASPSAAGKPPAGATPAAMAEDDDDPGILVLDALSERIRRAGSALAAAGAIFADLPGLVDWMQAQYSDPRRQERWIDLFVKVGAALLAAMICQALAFFLIQRPLRSLGDQPGASPWSNLALALLRAVIALVPIAIFAGAAYGVLGLVAPSRAARDVTQILVLAFVSVRAMQILGQVLLAPGAAPTRLLKVDDESAAYWFLWLRRLAATALYGYALIAVATRLNLPEGALEAMKHVLALFLVGLLTVLVLQNKTNVAERIRGRGGASGAFALLRQRMAGVWHILLLIYIAAAYAIWAFEISDGFRLVLRGSLVTIGILAIARAALYAIDKGFGRLLEIGEERRRAFPGLEARANRYLPALRIAARVLVILLACLAVLQGWGVAVLTWLGSEPGSHVLAKFTTIFLVALVTLLLWEASGAMLEYYLTRPNPDGTPSQRSARVRTLLPLARRTFTVVLGGMALLIILSELGLNIAPLLAGAGVAGIAIGFGAQTLVKDVITGLFILLEDNIAVGDIVNLGGNAGVVEDISLRTISLRDSNGTVHTVPYSEVSKIMNHTKNFAFAVFNIGVAYRENIDRVIEALKQLAEEFRAEPEWAPRILDPLEIWGVDQFADSAVIIAVRFRTAPAQQWSVKREFNKRIKNRFDELGIEMPFPHRTVYFGVDKEGKAPPLRIKQEGAIQPETASPKPADMKATGEKPA